MAATNKTPEIDKNQLIEAVAKLITLTQQRKIVWEPTPPATLAPRTESWVITGSFDTTYKGRRLRVYRFSFKPQTTTLSTLGQWMSSVSLQFVNDAGGVIWTFPFSPAHMDLMTAVEYQVAGVNEFLDSLLADD